MVGYWNNNNKRSFVAPTDFCNHSKLHQMLTPPSFHPISAPASFFPPPPAAFLHPPPPPHLRPSQVEREVRMEDVEAAAVMKGCRTEALPALAPGQQQHGFALPDDVAWVVERGGFLGEDFSVDDLLDFDGLETDKEADEEDRAEAYEVDNRNSSDSSAVSFEPPPVSDINLPTHDPAEFEWMSSIIDDSLPEYPPCSSAPLHLPPTQAKTHDHEPQNEKHRAQLPPPPRTVCNLSTTALVPVKAKRSKRRRIASSAWPAFGAATLSDSASSTTTTTSSSTTSSCSSSPSYSYFAYNHDGNLPPPKKRGRKPKQQSPQAAAAGGGARAVVGERRCTHCGVQKTPQWRTGPLGPKTLCNACGVRYKSRRLVPEYRPAASPTFVSHVHSNSHRKVLEMRRKKEEQLLAAAVQPVAS